MALVGTESSYVTFANGCGGSHPASRLVPRDTPRQGRELRVVLLDLPADSALVLFGWSRSFHGSAPLPISLGPLGMIGCSAFVSPDAMVAVHGAGGEATLQIPVPLSNSILGARFYNQALVLDVGANPMDAVVSDAAVGLIGK